VPEWEAGVCFNNPVMGEAEILRQGLDSLPDHE
jgi:hypothetical protein